MITEINKSAHMIEKAFNVAGSLPIIGIFSGTVRAIAGQVQAVAGATFALIGLVRQQFSTDAKWSEMTRAGVEHGMHGMLNVIRGLGESMLSTLVIGSAIPLAFNLYKTEKFSPYYEYGTMMPQQVPASV